MIKINPYLNFDGQAEEAFNFYKSVFGGEFTALMRFKEMPPSDGYTVAEEEKERIMHISLPIGDSTILMASDTSPSAGHKLIVGNNNYISLHPDTKEEAERLFKELSAGGNVEMPLEKMFWGAYFASFADKFGVEWMVNYEE